MSNNISQRKQDKNDWFNSVVRNSIIFLKTSVDNLDTSPRNSIVDLYTAIELLFKARLMREHWSLILTRPENANIASFESGDFHSVFLEQSEKRLRNICNEKFKKEAINNFKLLGAHRNQIVHFAHTGFDDKNDHLVIEHWASWFYLYDLVKNEWLDIFVDFQKYFDSIHRKMQNRKEFLQVKYDAISKIIDIEIKKGNEVENCPSCGFDSAVIKKNNDWGKDFDCLVCEVKDEIPKEIITTIPCERCDIEIAYFMIDNHKCNHCDEKICPAYALGEYTKIYQAEYEDSGLDDIDECYPIAFCHECDSNQASVIKINGLEVCVLCEVRGWRILLCEHCGNYATGDSEKVNYFACHLCEDDVRKFLDEEMAAFEAEMENET